jgi:hypothetical protein
MKHFILLSFIITECLFSVFAATTQGQDWKVRDHIPLDEFMIQSHRGAGNLAPENSLITKRFQITIFAKFP